MESSKQIKMFGIIEEKVTTGCSIVEICRKYNLTKDSFRYWNKKFEKINTKTNSDFIAIKICEPKPIKSPIKIIYPNHVELILDNSADVYFIKQLVTLF